jgi:RNA polymerase sigma-70 factor (ECF subfamily)
LSATAHPDGSVLLAELYEAYREPLRRYALRLARDAGRAEDLVQETFLRALPHGALLDGLATHQRRAWLYRVLKNVFLDQQRRAQRMDAILRRLAELAAVDDPPVVDAAAYALIEAAPAQHRDILVRRYILGRTSQQIGRELGLPAATVRSRLRLAIGWLRAHRDEFL